MPHDTAIPTPPEPDKPFLIELEQADRTPGGYFRPAASVNLLPTLRTSGLLAALPPEEVKSLLFLFTFIHPNGHCTATLQDLSHWMRVSPCKVRSRMGRLTAFHWQGRPIAHLIQRETALDTYSPAPEIVAVHHQPPEPEEAQTLPYVPAGREAVIAHSRAKYARPRKEVEAEIARLNGWEMPAETLSPEEQQAADLRIRLQAAGVPKPQAEILVRRFDHEIIEKQLAWLPYRNAKTPGRYLVAAIQDDYDMPAALRLAQEAEKDSEAEPPSSGTTVQEAGPGDAQP